MPLQGLVSEAELKSARKLMRVLLVENQGKIVSFICADVKEGGGV